MTDEARAEIARLQAPPSMSAMAKATTVWCAVMSSSGNEIVEAMARAIEQAAREARLQMLVDTTPLREAIAREARAAALEEIIDHLCRNPGAHPTIVVVGMIRALAAKPQEPKP